MARNITAPADAWSVIIDNFKAAWNNNKDKDGNALPYLLDNAEETPSLTKQSRPFAVCNIIATDSRPRGITGDLTRYDGRADITIYVPAGQGTREVNELSTPVILAFRKNYIDGVRFSSISPVDAGVKGRWFRRILTVPFFFYNNEPRN